MRMERSLEAFDEVSYNLNVLRLNDANSESPDQHACVSMSEDEIRAALAESHSQIQEQ